LKHTGPTADRERVVREVTMKDPEDTFTLEMPGLEFGDPKLPDPRLASPLPRALSGAPSSAPLRATSTTATATVTTPRRPRPR
jgi:hypothetical protein